MTQEAESREQVLEAARKWMATVERFKKEDGTWTDWVANKLADFSRIQLEECCDLIEEYRLLPTAKILAAIREHFHLEGK